MINWFKNIYATYNKVEDDIQVIIEDLALAKKDAFTLFKKRDNPDKLATLRLITQILDSELSARRYKQYERRMHHTFVLAFFSFIGGGVVISILQLFGH